MNLLVLVFDGVLLNQVDYIIFGRVCLCQFVCYVC